MKRSEMIRLGSHLIGCLALAVSLLVAPAFGGELSINVTSLPPGQALKPGTAVLLSVEGLEPGQTPLWHRVDVAGDVVLKLENYHLFAGTAVGPRTFIVQVASPGADPFAIATFDYGNGVDPDPPLPPEPEPPVPGVKHQVVIVFEREELDNLPRAQQVIIASLTFRERLAKAGHRLVAVVDQHSQGADGTAPAELTAYLAACEGDPLPRICLAPLAGGKVQDFPLPLTEDAVFELLDKGELP